MGDLIGFEGYLNTSTPFEYREHNALWKSSRRYGDFDFGNSYIDKCSYPRFWGDDGIEVVNNGTEDLIGCRDSDFDQVLSKKDSQSDNILIVKMIVWRDSSLWSIPRMAASDIQVRLCPGSTT